MARTDPPQRTVISEVDTTIVEPPQIQNVATTWPEFGLPRNYSPQYEINHGVGQSAQQTVQMPVVTEQRPIIHTIPQVPFGNHFTYQADGSQNGDQVQNDEVEEVKEKYNAIEKRLKVVEENDTFGFDTSNLCLVSDLVIPTKFKVPEFKKYKGLTCPKDHLTMYFRKMMNS